VRKGARKPDISSVEAFKRAVLDAKSIAYLRLGSGAYLHGLFERMGIAERIEAKVTRPQTDVVSEMVASTTSCSSAQSARPPKLRTLRASCCDSCAARRCSR
jgi:hypothetical protein